jgi:hypothetical protein
MNNQLNIPHGNEQVAVQLTVRELLALSGDNFYQDHKLLIEARKKLRQQIETKTTPTH